jgi:hypothetical protein
LIYRLASCCTGNCFKKNSKFLLALTGNADCLVVYKCGFGAIGRYRFYMPGIGKKTAVGAEETLSQVSRLLPSVI